MAKDEENNSTYSEIYVLCRNVTSFYLVTRELSLVILLVTPTNQLATTISLLFTDRGWYPYTNGIVFLLTIVVVGCTILSRRVMGTSLAKGLGG